MTISRADLIILTMHDALLRELQEGLARGGPESALAACHSNSAAVSWRLATREGIASGRTSNGSVIPPTQPRHGLRLWLRRTPAGLHVVSTASRLISEARWACCGRLSCSRCARDAMDRPTE